MSTLWVLGSLTVDEHVLVPRLPGGGEVVVADEARPRTLLGGAGGRQALAGAAVGAPVRLLAAVGDDEAGRGYRARLEAAGVDVSGVVTDLLAPTGRSLVAVDPEGVRTAVVLPGASAADVDVSSLRRALPGDVLLVALDVPAAVVTRAVAAVDDLDVRVVLVAQPFARLPQHVLDRCDPVAVDESGATALADAGLLPPSLLVTFGGRGLSWQGEERSTGGPVDLHALAGTLAARVALGDPDDEALDAAVAAAAGDPAGS